jgi:alkylated DNA repair dioxygenase AlkB
VSQGQLFPPSPASLPEGFVYQPDFLSEADEAELLGAIKRENFEAFDFHGYTAKRRSIEYGLEYDFGSQRANPTRPFADFLLPIRERAAAFARRSSDALVEGMILEYPPGAPIGWHRDAPQFGTVIGISLLNAARMRLKPYNKEGKIVSVTLEPRSIYVLSGPVRWQWQHSIPAMEKTRYSITFRTLRADEKRRAG